MIVSPTHLPCIEYWAAPCCSHLPVRQSKRPVHRVVVSRGCDHLRRKVVGRPAGREGPHERLGRAGRAPGPEDANPSVMVSQNVGIMGSTRRTNMEVDGMEPLDFVLSFTNRVGTSQLHVCESEHAVKKHNECSLRASLKTGCLRMFQIVGTRHTNLTSCCTSGNWTLCNFLRGHIVKKKQQHYIVEDPSDKPFAEPKHIQPSTIDKLNVKLWGNVAQSLGMHTVSPYQPSHLLNIGKRRSLFSTQPTV